MTKLIYTLFGILTSSIGFSQVQIEQFVIGNLGPEIENGSVSFIHSIGDVAGTFIEGPQVSFTQGFPQSFGDASVGVVEVSSGLDLDIFPNPTTGWVQLKGDIQSLSTYELVTVNGKIIRRRAFDRPSIDLRACPSGMYLIRLYDQQGQWVATLKVLKEWS